MNAPPWLAVPVGLVLAATLNGPARAGWTPPQVVPVAGDAQLVAGAPGQAALMTATDDGQITTVAHAPGGAWGVPQVVTTLDPNADPLLGPGGAFIGQTVAGQYVVGQVGPDGALARLVPAPGQDDLEPLGVAAGPDGSLAALLDDSDGRALRVLIAVPGASALTRVGASLSSTSGGKGAIVGLADGTFAAAWSEQPATAPTRISTVVFRTAQGMRRVAASVADPTSTLARVTMAAAGTRATVTWLEGQAQGTNSVNAARITAGAAGPGSVVGTAGASASLSIADAPAGGSLIAWSADPRAAPAGFVGVGPGGAVSCPPGGGLASQATALRGEQLVAVGVDLAQAVAGTTLLGTGGCGGDAIPPGPPVADAGGAAAAADGEATLALGLSGEDTTTLLAEDRTPPAVTDAGVPGQVPEGAAFDVSAAGSDAWGPVAIAWQVDGQDAATGSPARLGPLSPGDHTVRLVLRDAAGNVADRSFPVTAIASAPPPSPPPPPAQPDPVVVVPPTEVPIVAPPSTEEPTTSPRRAKPRIRSLSLVRSGGRWEAHLVLRDARRVRFSLFRETYAQGGGSGGRGPTPCGAQQPSAHGVPGLQGRGHRGAHQARRVLRVALPPAFQRALAVRGRYTLRAVALGGARRSAAASVRRTVC